MLIELRVEVGAEVIAYAILIVLTVVLQQRVTTARRKSGRFFQAGGQTSTIYKSALGNTLSEFVILITAREWSQDYEWHVHYPIALKVGIKQEIADAIKDGRRPVGMSADEEMLYDFSIELHRNKRVSDTTFARVEKRFGKKGVVDLVGINSYYTLLAMQMNVAQYAIPKDGKKLPRFPD